MKRVDYPEAVHGLIRSLRRLPGVGPRSAERMALWLLQGKRDVAEILADSIRETVTKIRPCERCGFFAEEGLCEFCRDSSRAQDLICVVEQATDILPIERTGVFRGGYHSLGGRISPLDHIGPEDLRIGPLLQRVRDEGVREVILALGGDVESEATSNYLRELLKQTDAAVSRIAQGMPAGVGLEHADDLTLSRALAGRVRV